jgi:hypothetical protein
MEQQRKMEANVRARLGGLDGISEGSLGFYEGEEEMVAFSDHCCSVVHRDPHCHVERVGHCPIYLFTVLRRVHDDQANRSY